MKSHYDLLGVTRDADAETLKQAHRRALKASHPDLRDGDLLADRRSQQINAAYDVLKDAQKRATYDVFLRQRRQNLRLLAITGVLTAATAAPATYLLLTGIVGRERLPAEPAPVVLSVPAPAEDHVAEAVDRASAAFAEMVQAEKQANNAVSGAGNIVETAGSLEADQPPGIIDPTGARIWQRLVQTKNPFDLLVFTETFAGTPEASFAEDRLSQLIHCNDNIPELIAIGGKAKGHIADSVRERLMTLIRITPPGQSPKPQPEADPAGETAIADASGTPAAASEGEMLAEAPVEAVPQSDPTVGQTVPTSASHASPETDHAALLPQAGGGKPALPAAPRGPTGGDSFAEIVPVDPDDAESYLRRAAAWIGRGNLDKALADYDLAIRIDDGNVAAYRGRGLLWRQRGDTDKALADLDRAIRLSVSDPDIYRERGLIWYERGRHDRAIADFNRAIKLAPDFALAYLFRGEARLQTGDFRAALTDFEHALRLSPHLTEAMRGRDLAQLGARDQGDPRSRTE